eukprot:1192288-Prorocentrum_minimum.AAC.2
MTTVDGACRLPACDLTASAQRCPSRCCAGTCPPPPPPSTLTSSLPSRLAASRAGAAPTNPIAMQHRTVRHVVLA